MTATYETAQDFANAVELLGYEEMNSRVISVAGMVLAESESTSEVEMNRGLPQKRSRFPGSHEYHQVKGWVKRVNESCILPVGPSSRGIDLGLDTAYVGIEAHSQDWYYRRLLVPRAFGKISVGDSVPGSSHASVVLREYVGNDEAKIKNPTGDIVQISDWSGFTRNEANRAQVERAAEMLSCVISYNNIQITDPVVRTLEEYQD